MPSFKKRLQQNNFEGITLILTRLIFLITDFPTYYSQGGSRGDGLGSQQAPSLEQPTVDRRLVCKKVVAEHPILSSIFQCYRFQFQHLNVFGQLQVSFKWIDVYFGGQLVSGNPLSLLKKSYICFIVDYLKIVTHT